jgi:hypothetical protein
MRLEGCRESPNRGVLHENSVFNDDACNAQRLQSGRPDDTAQLFEEKGTLFFGSGCWDEDICVWDCAKRAGELQAVGPL